jgi:hypothetical protein
MSKIMTTNFSLKWRSLGLDGASLYLVAGALVFLLLEPTDSAWGQQACLSWIHKPSVGTPGKRRSHAMAYDSDRGVTVFFGGEFSGGGDDDIDYYNDTWEYDGSSWKQIVITGTKPSPRSGHAMAYDAARNRLVLCGGVNNSGYSSETWVYASDGTVGTWTQHFPSPNPSGSGGFGGPAGHGMVYDSSRLAVVLHGGTVYTADSDFSFNLPATWEWDGTAWIRRYELPFNEAYRTRHAMAFDPDRRITVLFGGMSYHINEDGYANTQEEELGRGTWEYNGAWSRAGGGTPLLRHEHAMAYDMRRRKIVMFGGKDANEDVWVIGNDTDEYTAGIGWTSLYDSGPPPRARHAMVYDSGRDVMVLFGGGLVTGGVDFGSIYGDTWELVDECVHPQERWVDFNYTGGVEMGTFTAPFNTLSEGVTSVFPRGTIKIKSGARNETLTISKALTLEAFGGPVIIGR